MDDALFKEILEFLIHQPALQTSNGLRATLLSAGLEDFLPDLNLNDAPRNVITLLINQLAQEGELPDGEYPLIHFLLQGVATLVGKNRQQELQNFCDRFRTWAKTNFPTRSVVSQWEGQQCAHLDILGRPVPIETHYQVLPLLREVKKERLLREPGKHSKEEETQERRFAEELKKIEIEEEEEMPNRLPGVDILRWEEELRAEQVTYEKLTLEQVFADFRSSVKEARSDVPRFVVLGPPGSGKTTLIQYLAWQMANQKLMVAKRQVMPVRVRLRDWETWAVKPQHPEFGLPEYLAERYKDLTSAPMVRQWRSWLQRGDVFLLLDGLDEISNNTSFVEALKTTLSTFKDCAAVLTCRTVSFEQHRVLCPDFPVFTLAGLEAAQRDAYIQIFPAQNPAPYDAQKLIEHLTRTPQMQPLAANPLLLAIICYVVDDPQGIALPARRSELYDKAVRKFLTYHQQHPRVAVVYPGTPLDEDDKRKILEHVAFRLFVGVDQQRHLTITQEQLKTAFKDAVVQLDYVSDTAPLANALCQDLTANSGILRGDAEQGYFFLHLTFQEFLTAAYLARLVNNAEQGWETEIPIGRKKVAVKKVVDKKAWDPRWQEVLILFTGLLDNPAPWLQLLMEKKKDDYFRHRLAFAALCLPELTFDLREKHAELVSRITADTFSLWWRHYVRGTRDVIPHVNQILPALGQVNGLVVSNPIRLWLSGWINCLTNSKQNGVPLLDWLANLLGYSPVDLWFSPFYPDYNSNQLWIEPDNTEIQQMIMDAVAAIGSVAATPEFLTQLADLLYDLNESVRKKAVEVIEAFGTTAATPEFLTYLANLLLKKEVWWETTVKAIGGLGSAAATQEILTRLANLVCDPDEYDSVRRASALTIRQLESVTVVPPEILIQLAHFHLLCDPDRDVRWTAAWAARQLGSVTVPPEIFTRLPNLLCDPDEIVRWAAIQVVENSGIVATTPDLLICLIDLLGDSDQDVREAATEAVIRCKTPKTNTLILNRLADMLGDLENGLDASTAIQIIGNTATLDFLARLFDFLRAPENEDVQWKTAQSLWKTAQSIEWIEKEVLWGLEYIPPAPEFLAHLVDFLHDPNENVRRATLKISKSMGITATNPDILSCLMDLLYDSDWGTWKLAGEMMETLELSDFLVYLANLLHDRDIELWSRIASSIKNKENIEVSSEFLRHLSDLLCDQKREIRWAAVHVVRGMGSIAATPGILIHLTALLEDPEDGIRRAVKEVIRTIGDRAATPEFLAHIADLLSKPDDKIKLRAAAEGISALGNAAATPEILASLPDLLCNRDEDLKEIALKMVENLGSKAATPQILTCLTNLLSELNEMDWIKGLDMGWAIKGAIGSLGSAAATPELLACLICILNNSNDFEVKIKALVIVKELGKGAATPQILSCLTDRLNDPDVMVTSAAKNAIWAIIAAMSESLPYLTELLNEPNGVVVQEAVSAINALGSAAATPEFLICLTNMLHDRDKEEVALSIIEHLGRAAITPEILTRLAKLLRVDPFDLDRMGGFGLTSRQMALPVVANLGRAAATPQILACIVNQLPYWHKKVRQESAKTLARLMSQGIRIFKRRRGIFTKYEGRTVAELSQLNDTD